jgi:hypothetical protein
VVGIGHLVSLTVMVLVKVDDLVKKVERRGTAKASLTTEDLSPDTELTEIYKKLDLEGKIVTVKQIDAMLAGC